MTTNVVLNVSRQPEWIHAFGRARTELGWEPKYWITYEENHEQVGKEFPNAIRHPRLDLNRGIMVGELRSLQFGALSSDELHIAEPYIYVALEIFDRFDLDNSLNLLARQRLIHKLLCYWRNAIEEFSLDVGVFSAPPHSIGNYLLYGALKMAGKVIKIFNSASIENLTFVSTDIGELPDKLLAGYEAILDGRLPLLLSEGVRNAIAAVKEAQPSFRPWYVKAAESREDRRHEIIREIESRIGKDLVVTERFLPDRPIRRRNGKPIRKHRGDKGMRELARAFKIPGRALNDRKITLQEHDDYRDWAMTRKVALREEYRALCGDLPGGQPFIYFGLHYQPERTTCPEGGRFSSQYLCCALLSQGVPDGWQIVIKEHPTQFRYTAMGELGRWRGYYEDFLGLGNVRFVDLDTSSIELIDRSRAVATINGAVGWEALVRGKPVAYFGAPWYGGCHGAYRINCPEDVSGICREIESGRTPKERNVLAYAASLERIGRSVFTSPTMAGAIEAGDDMGDMFFDLLRESEANDCR